jgi:hypothetical protein
MAPPALDASWPAGDPHAWSIYDVPSLDSPVIARSTLSDGAPYVIVCDTPTGLETLNAVFIHRIGS